MAPMRSTASRPASACAPAPATSRAISPTRRYFGQGSYRFDSGRHHVQATGMAGGITGQAPLFERFTLGDSSTLRGWDKYEIAPAGGDRVVHSSVEYRYTGVALFLDVGSVWDANTERHVRVVDRLRIPRGAGVLHRRLPAEHRQSERHRHDGSADLRESGSGGSTSPAGRRGVARLLAWPAVRCVGTGADCRYRRRCAEDPRARLQLPERETRSLD